MVGAESVLHDKAIKAEIIAFKVEKIGTERTKLQDAESTLQVKQIEAES